MVTAQFFERVSGIFTQHHVFRVCEYEISVPHGDGVAQVAGNIVFPMSFTRFEIDRHQISGLSVSPIVSDYAIADPQTRLDFETSFAITVDDFGSAEDIYDRVALAVAGPNRISRLGSAGLSIDPVAGAQGNRKPYRLGLQIVATNAFLWKTAA